MRCRAHTMTVTWAICDHFGHHSCTHMAQSLLCMQQLNMLWMYTSQRHRSNSQLHHPSALSALKPLSAQLATSLLLHILPQHSHLRVCKISRTAQRLRHAMLLKLTPGMLVKCACLSLCCQVTPCLRTLVGRLRKISRLHLL